MGRDGAGNASDLASPPKPLDGRECPSYPSLLRFDGQRCRVVRPLPADIAQPAGLAIFSRASQRA